MLGLLIQEKEPQSTAKQQKNNSLKGLFQGALDGWSEDKERFKHNLINDIKSLLFTKWQKEWRAGLAFDESGKLLNGFRNLNGRLYRNLANVASLQINSKSNPFFITLKHLEKLGGKILDKTKAVWLISYVPMWKDPENKTPRKPDFVIPKFHKVINLDFVKGVKSPKIKMQNFQKLELNEYVENFILELKKRRRIPKLVYDQADQCFYRYGVKTYSPESIHLVQINNFKNIEAYYSTLFHEITHSTKNPKRLGRGKMNALQTLDYANEELVAELGAMILCEELGLKYNRQNSLTYLNSWMKRTKNVDTALLEAYSYAADAAEYLLKDIDLNKLVPKTMKDRVNSESPEQMELPLSGSFNEGIKKFFKGVYHASLFNLGKPSKLLIKLGFPNKDVILTTSTLAKKIDKHSLSLDDLQGLNNDFKKPVLVFKSANIKDAFNVIIDKKKAGKLLCVSIHTDAKYNRMVITKIASIHPRRDVQLVNWKDKGLLLFEDKKKAVKHFGNFGFNCQKRNNVNGFDTNVKKENKNTKFSTDLQNTTTLDEWKPNTHIKPLKTDLGKFLGGYEQNQFAIVLRGEKGAGKTRMLCQMINLFALKKLKGLFLSLEVSPESELFGKYLSYISPTARKNVAVSNQNSIEQLEKYCQEFDFIAIDSWGKLQDINQGDFGRLVAKYPNVIWLVIFQSTTAGTARGGIMSEYDSSIVIQVANGGNAECEKNRYNSCDLVYNVFTKKLKENENK